MFLKNIGSIINVAEPCESLIKDKVREIMNENQNMLNVSSCALGSLYGNPLISLSFRLANPQFTRAIDGGIDAFEGVAGDESVSDKGRRVSAWRDGGEAGESLRGNVADAGRAHVSVRLSGEVGEGALLERLY